MGGHCMKVTARDEGAVSTEMLCCPPSLPFLGVCVCVCVCVRVCACVCVCGGTPRAPDLCLPWHVSHCVSFFTGAELRTEF